MFEIGSSLREARRQRGLELDAVQRELRIRRRYLEAIESDRFDLLPGDVYARGFLREYAEFLGLDGSLYLNEFAERFATHEETPIAATPSVARAQRRSRLPLLLALGLVVAAVVGVAAWRLGSAGTHPRPLAHVSTTTARKTVPKHRVHRIAPPAPKRAQAARLVVTASRGDCWLLVRVGSATGPVLYGNTLRRGTTVRLSFRKPLWIRFGAGGNVDATVDGRALRGVPAVVGNLLVPYGAGSG